jgi:diphthamide synthase subunit DPH2
VKQLSEMQILERDEFKAEKRKLEKLYRKIYLVLTDRHKGISDELQSIRKGRRTLKAYRRSI